MGKRGEKLVNAAAAGLADPRGGARFALSWPMPCAHRDQVRLTQLPASVDGCEDCLASGGKWVHLRICLECGKVGCCDSSPGRHARAHAESSGHPLIRTLEPGESWSWCFLDEVGMILPEVRGKTRIPASPLG
jgi:uncharacterized UBP type Zn finger protein